jgi:hypothetical protein
MKSFALLGAVLLSGCASMTNRFGTATMEADPTELGAESIVLQNELALAYTRARPIDLEKEEDAELCRFTQPSFQEQNKHPYARHTERRDDGSSPDGYYRGKDKFKCVYLRHKASDKEVKNHLLAGLALSDLYCDTYFRRIARRWNERLFLRNTTNDVGAAISAVLGLAKAGSGITGGVGAAFGLADGAFRNYDNVFVVSPDLPAMQKLVKEHQSDLREAFLADAPTDYYSAQSKIIEYASLCSYTGMKGLLNQAVDQTINDLRGTEGVRTAVVSAATTADAQRRAIAEKRATEAEGELAAVRREKAAQEALKQEKKPSGDGGGDQPEVATEPGNDGDGGS